jgi:hypothetical protein
MVTWPPCFGASVEVKHQGEESMAKQSCSPHGGQEAQKEKRGKGSGAKYPLPRYVSSVYFFQPGPPPKFPPPPNIANSWGPSLQHMGLR